METFFNPTCILKETDCCGEGDVVEFGCGYGLFTLAASTSIEGTLLAFDIEPTLVEETAKKAFAAGLLNVRAEVRGFVAHGCGCSGMSVRHAMLYNILLIAALVDLLREAFRIIRPGGTVGIIHSNYDQTTPRGPSLEIRPTAEQCRVWAERAGLEYMRNEDLCCCSWHWGPGYATPNSRVSDFA